MLEKIEGRNKEQGCEEVERKELRRWLDYELKWRSAWKEAGVSMSKLWPKMVNEECCELGDLKVIVEDGVEMSWWRWEIKVLLSGSKLIVWWNQNCNCSKSFSKLREKGSQLLGPLLPPILRFPEPRFLLEKHQRAVGSWKSVRRRWMGTQSVKKAQAVMEREESKTWKRQFESHFLFTISILTWASISALGLFSGSISVDHAKNCFSSRDHFSGSERGGSPSLAVSVIACERVKESTRKEGHESRSQNKQHNP